MRKREGEKLKRYSRYEGAVVYIKRLEDIDDEQLRKVFAKF